MGVVFVVLSVLAIFIKAFDLVDARVSAREAANLASGADNVQVSAPPGPAAAIREPDDAETAAVIGVALALADEERNESAGDTTTPNQQVAGSNWVSTGRSREMSGRVISPPRRGLRNS